ncbi:predicted protein [Thalassiosira pseudonana CCMP1335]|uniref:Glutamate-1-semialdehyde 2,1-aminomutase n=1 Tax=Thalassiosira pseudonana TaxID=35128 RepID=B5YMK2_THAPS|nr:predicted protein [Thalassiosira pseudonana CCMP1335]ACI64822.1 predicted protein [Thalassiosira pseudonana CCMP1335]
MGPVATLVLAFMVLSLITKFTWEKIEFFLKSNIKYRIMDSLAAYIYYGDDIGVEASLKLDSPSSDIYQRRLVGQQYLASKLEATKPKDGVECHGKTLAASLVDCRFALAKVRNGSPHNDVNGTFNGSASAHDEGAAGILTVVTEDGVARPYVGNDAVHTLGVESFYAPIQKEVNRQMSLDDKENKESMMRYCPIAMNSALEKNVGLIKRLTGMDKVRYALSGSEAVDAALKDIKASCKNKPLIVRFTSAYHGHVSGVSFLACDNHVFLPECAQDSIDFIERYHYRIAAVIVNPMQHFTGVNKPSPPGEKVTHSSRIRSSVPRDEYARWLHSLQYKCNYCTKYLSKVALVMDDIYFAFRTPDLLSSQYFLHPDTQAPLKPDVMILGKALAAGYPLSAVVGREGFLNSYDKKFLLQVNKTVGTLAAWHGGIIASNVFLEALEGRGGSDGQPLLKIGAKEQFSNLVRKCDAFSQSLNARFANEGLPVRIRNFSNTFSFDFLNKSLYNSRYPQYLLAEGIFLGNYSTGKFNLNADVTMSDWKCLEEKFVSAASKMQRDGYFEPMKSAAKTKLYLSLMTKFARNYAWIYYNQIMNDKHIDIEVSHNHPVNKFGHFWSSVGMIVFAYPLLFWYCDPLKGCLCFFLTHVVRQSGHFFYEHQDKNIEKLKFGHKDASKKEAVVFLSLATLVYKYRETLYDFVIQYIDPSFLELTLEQYVLAIALFTVVPHFVEICYQYGWLRGVSWALKILTDPFTDLLDFYTHVVIHPKWFLDLKEQRATYQLDITTKKVVKVA